MKVTVTTSYLEMADPGQLRPARPSGLDLRVQRAEVPCPELNRFFYTSVGGDWYWIDRLGWSYERWLAYLERPELETWVGYVAGTPAGYCELEQQGGNGVEIVSFGLLPQFRGRGAGGELLSRAVERAWSMKAVRVWLHTCTLDGPRALANYQARGFTLYREEVSQVDVPEEAPGPWPGAYQRRSE